MDFLRFSCSKCAARLRIPPKMAGKSVVCPKCQGRTLAPELDDLVTYAMADEAAPAARKAEAGDPLEAAWNCGPDVIPEVRAALNTAKPLARNRQWQLALSHLNRVYERGQAGTTAQRQVLRKPLAFSLANWAADDLAQLNPARARLSRPLRRILEQAASFNRWGGHFPLHNCSACEGRLVNITACRKLRTIVGYAYLCCVAPTKEDGQLVRSLDTIWLRLSHALQLEPENALARRTLDSFPGWYAVLMTPDCRAEWCGTVEDIKSSFGASLAEVILWGLAAGIASD